MIGSGAAAEVYKGTYKEMDVAIKRLEAGEDPDKIEEDIGDVLGEALGDMTGESGRMGGGYSQDPGLYDY